MFGCRFGCRMLTSIDRSEQCWMLPKLYERSEGRSVVAIISYPWSRIKALRTLRFLRWEIQKLELRKVYRHL